MKKGYWAFISNCHLLLSWLPALEKIVNKIQSIKVHPNFRLWLGSCPTEHFPVSVLQCSVVLTLDSPKGIRANMLQLYDMVKTDKEYENCVHQSQYKNLLFSLSFFHSVISERKKFQNLGWNCEYNFTLADFRVAEKLLRLYLDEYKDISWEALAKMVAEVNYGGHIADKLDERLLMTYYNQYFCDEACATEKFCLSTMDIYHIPEEGPIMDYVEYITHLPTVDVPDVFEQHCNAEIPHLIQNAEELLRYFLKMRGEELSDAETDLNQLLLIIADVEQHIPEPIEEELALGILNVKPDPYGYILVQETYRYNNLVKVVSKTLNDLRESINGNQVMTENLEALSETIQRGKIPNEWQKAYPSLKPLGSWILDFKLRVHQFSDWCSTSTMPVKLWLPGFTAPASVLNATLQTAMKTNDVMLKDLVWEYHVSTLDEAHIREAPADGIYARGLYLEGAGWDRTNCILVEPEPLQLVTAMPVIHFKPVVESSMRGLYTCPCYYTSRRMDKTGKSSYLFSVDLKTKKTKEHWIKRGTSLLMNTED